jgi:preprotein translocase subunit YajC
MIRPMIQLLQTSPAQAPGGLLQFAPMIFIFVIFYFLLIAPMRKKQKKTREMLAKLKKGDEVITNGGIFGKVDALDEERGFVVLRIADNVRIKIQRGAIAGLVAEPPTPGA